MGTRYKRALAGGNAEGSKTARFEDAIQMSNIYWSSQGFENSYYRSGQSHKHAGGKPLTQQVATGIPSYLNK